MQSTLTVQRDVGRLRAVMADTTVRSSSSATIVSPATTAAIGWQMWVPCIGMALCSWLSFVDRQVLNILAPTSESVFASDGQPLALSGTATDGLSGPSQILWTNYVPSGAEFSKGLGYGTTAWTVTNVALATTLTNRICVLGRGTSYYGPFGGATTFNSTLQVIFPPVIVAQPQDKLVNEGSPASFSVTSAPVGSAFTYRWLFNGDEIAGASAATYTLAAAHYTNSGNYSVRVSNSFGSVRSADAVLTGVETRTSSPIRIKRNRDDLQSINTQGLYPCGEGAGYAGGILSAAVDGIEVAEQLALDIVRQLQS